MQLSDFDYDLPQLLIAQQPVEPRDASRLLHVASDGALADSQMRQFVELLRLDDVLVFNNTKVIPAQLHGLKGESKIGVTLLKHQQNKRWECFAKPARKLSVGDVVRFGHALSATLISKQETGTVVFEFDKADAAFFAALSEVGQMPLPPYIKREQKQIQDDSSYQTIYAEKSGAVAAPTAGLHFSETLMAALKQKGIQIEYVTLHVGGGTFLPVRVEDIAQHQMHSEWMEIDTGTCAALNQAKEQGRRIVSVGTTALRCLESAVNEAGVLQPQHRETDIFITPGYAFKAVDALLTNFHLPKSTLFMLVSAFSGLNVMKQAYAHAVAQEYRFFSYGDACLLERA